jgi:hypothetical protein
MKPIKNKNMKKQDYYLTEWTDKDFDKVNKAIQNYFGGKFFINHRKEKVYFPHNYYEIEKILGLPYTSTSICPMLSMDCNVQILMPCKISIPVENDFYFSHVVLDKDKDVVLIAWDKEENEKFIVCK